MTTNTSLKQSPYMTEWMAQADPLKEANTVKKTNGRSGRSFSFQIKREITFK